MTNPLRMDIKTALFEAATRPENIYYPHCLVDQGGLRYNVEDIRTRVVVATKLGWMSAKSLAMELNAITEEKWEHIPLKNRSSVALYLIQRMREVSGQRFLDLITKDFIDEYARTLEEVTNKDYPLEAERVKARAVRFRERLIKLRGQVESHKPIDKRDEEAKNIYLNEIDILTSGIVS